jgi:hypothetical protein
VKNSSAQVVKKQYRIRHRRKYDCPLKLEALLTKMNWLEPEITLWTFNDALRLVRDEKPNLSDYEAIQEALKICLDGLPKKLQNLVKYGVPILPEDDAEKRKLFTYDFLTDIHNRILRYEDFRLSRLKLSRLAYFYEKDKERELRADYSVRTINEDFGGTGNLQVDEKGIVNIVNDSFGEAINGVILDRVRRCEICERVFWAANVNSKACSPNHASNLRNRQSRMRNKEKRQENRELDNAKRREIYAYKKKLKKGK